MPHFASHWASHWASRWRFPVLVSLAGALSLSACAVGPDFVKPQAPVAAGFAPTPLPATTTSDGAMAGDAQHFVTELAIPFDWWKAFGSPALDALVTRALKNNPSLPSAEASLRQAQELVTAQQGYFFPTIGADYTFERQQVAGNLSSNDPGPQGNGAVILPTGPAKPVIYNMHMAQLTVGYTPDVFGANRRQVESLDAQAELQRDQLQATYVTLASNVVAAAIQEASTRDQITAVNRLIAADRKTVELLAKQLRTGYAMRIDLAGAEASLAQSEQQLPPLVKQLEQTRDLIRVLVGSPPDQEVEQIDGLSALRLPTELPLSLPSKIVEQRPDVRAAEQQLRAANAQIGIAVAARLPQFSISGALGGTATQFNQIFSQGGPFWNIVGDVSAPLFDGNALLHRERAADQALLQAAAQYRSTVLTAYQNVADTLHALHTDAEALRSAGAGERATRVALDLTRRRNQAGYVNSLAVLSAEATYQQAALTLFQAEALRFGDTAALYQALGGGWWNRPDLAADDAAPDPVFALIK